MYYENKYIMFISYQESSTLSWNISYVRAFGLFTDLETTNNRNWHGETAHIFFVVVE